MTNRGTWRHETPAQAEISVLWETLCVEGATRFRDARLDTWLKRRYAVAAPVFLTEAQAAEAAGVLREWLARHRAQAGAGNGQA